ncbi:MAG: efflux RND transporter periplasmic adaptor subunit [Bryobacteraceae bacterium]|nr:efflux RND transporter periplasmic adaptor subunit [Bryobacteraceae bacterium]
MPQEEVARPTRGGIPERLGSSKRKLALAALVAALATVAAAAWRVAAKPAAPAYDTIAIRRQTIAKTISATGKLQAVTTVQVGTQVSGTIAELYADFNTQVKKGQVIARLDPAQLQAQLAQANANYLSAQANAQGAQNAVLSADASVQAAEANFARAESAAADAQRTYDRNTQLVDAGVGARMTLESSEAALVQAQAQKQQAAAQVNQAKAQAQSARSQLAQANAQVQQTHAAVQLASVNLDHTIIKAPIDGVVVERNVDVGQTVAASLQAPTIFLIANDLTRMQVLAEIDEADVGQLSRDSRVSFTVDAYPNDVFRGRIAQVRLAPQMVQNVVTYTAVVEVDNPDLKLKPGMTANVTAIVAQREDVLAVPNAALRFRPESGGGQQAQRPVLAGHLTVWKVTDEGLVPVSVRTGLTDGIFSEIVSGDLSEGDRVAAASSNGAGRAGAQAPARSIFQTGRTGRR